MSQAALRNLPIIFAAALAVLAAPGSAATEPHAEAAHDSGYQLGQGYELRSLGLTVGGYANVVFADDESRSARLSPADLSLFLTYRPAERWQFFAEIEVGEAFELSADGVRTEDADFDLERLYLDYTLMPAASVRLGKFLTPIGRWNVLHAAPLVWTTSRPLITQRAFARQATGAMVFGSLLVAGNDLDYSLYADDSDELDPERERAETVGPNVLPAQNFDNAAGANLRYSMYEDQLQLGLSYANFEIEGSRERKNLVGADLRWTPGRAEITAEAVYRASTGGDENDEWGAFLQAAVPLKGNLFGVVRGEIYDGAAGNEAAVLGTAGIAYRPSPPIVLKLEHLWGSNNRLLSPDAWLASIAILF
jgi:hypothetical protein